MVKKGKKTKVKVDMTERCYVGDDGTLYIPDHVTPYYNQGVNLVKEGKLEEAVLAFVGAIGLKPEHIDSHFNLGVVYYALHRLKEARQEYEIVLELRPHMMLML